MKVYSEKELPKRCENSKEFSVDVLCVDDLGLNYLAFYDYKDKEWRFHGNHEPVSSLVWIYIPEELKFPTQ